MKVNILMRTRMKKTKPLTMKEVGNEFIDY